MLRRRPEKWGSKFKLEGATVASTHAGPNSIRFVPAAHTALVFFTTEPQWQTALNSDRKIRSVAPAGSLAIVPAESEAFALWTAQKHSLRLDIDADRLNRLAGLEFEGATFELQSPKPGIIDGKAHTLATWMRQEINNAGLGRQETLDSLVTIFGTHLLRNHTSLKGRQEHLFNGGLSAGTWRRVSDFIQAHLDEVLPLERLAAVARLSPSHFSRAFKQTVGQPPHQYVVSARLLHARNLIVGTDAPLSQVAKSAGFSNHSHMTATMKQIWKTTPTEFRKKQLD